MTVIAFVGAGSVVFTRQLVADLLAFDDLGPVALRLHDIDPERLRVAEGVVHAMAEGRGDVTVAAHGERRAALAGADFVVDMIQVGGIEATRRDLEIPAAHGILQTIGDTTGIGGISRALRTFPVLRGILEDMRVECPDAILLNYTNPMTMNLWWAQAVAPDIAAIGLCHSVYWTVHDLCELVGVDVAAVQHRAAGLNHQSWLLEWTLDGEDLYPRLAERIAGDEQLRRRVRVEMLRRIGRFPTETSEHSAEYLPWFLHHPEQRERFRLEPLEYVGISEQNLAEFEDLRRRLDTGTLEAVAQEDAAEYAPQVIHSIVTGTPREIHGTVPNAGLIDSLPEAAVVEVPVRVDASGLAPVAMGALPPACAAVNQPMAHVAALTVRGALEEDATLVRQALLVDPNASASVPPETAWRAFDELVGSQGSLLPSWVGA